MVGRNEVWMSTYVSVPNHGAGILGDIPPHNLRNKAGKGVAQDEVLEQAKILFFQCRVHSIKEVIHAVESPPQIPHREAARQNTVTPPEFFS